MNRIPTIITTSIQTNLPTPQDDLVSWCQKQMIEQNLPWLLAHADDGVIWGELRDDVLVMPSNAAQLRVTTIQQLRLFGETGELLLWRDDSQLHVRLQLDTHGGSQHCLDEDYLLWGDQGRLVDASFTQLSEGGRGIRHTIPLIVQVDATKRARLRVRHYVQEDPQTGMVRIEASRLVSLTAPKGATR